jgi:hypothetical protein
MMTASHFAHSLWQPRPVSSTYDNYDFLEQFDAEYRARSRAMSRIRSVLRVNHQQGHVKLPRAYRKLQYLPSCLPYLRFVWRESF